MTFITSSLQTEIDDLTHRHTTFKQNWLDKQRNISNLLASAVVACRKNADDVHHTKQQIRSSDTNNDPEFERLVIDYITKHAPVSITTLAQIFSKEDEEINNLLKNLKIKFDTDGKTVLSLEQTSNSNLSKSSSSPIKRSFTILDGFTNTSWYISIS